MALETSFQILQRILILLLRLRWCILLLLLLLFLRPLLRGVNAVWTGCWDRWPSRRRRQEGGKTRRRHRGQRQRRAGLWRHKRFREDCYEKKEEKEDEEGDEAKADGHDGGAARVSSNLKGGHIDKRVI